MISSKIETRSDVIIGGNVGVLNEIKNTQTNIAIWERDINSKASELKKYIDESKNFPIMTFLKGDFRLIESELKRNFTSLESDIINWLLNDIIDITSSFFEITGKDNITLMLARINNGMCKRFHADKNELRLLCTYIGPGTEWLYEDNVNREALNSYKDNEFIVRNSAEIQHLKSGDAAIIKGANYNNSAGLVHRSPELNSQGISRLLLKLDAH